MIKKEYQKLLKENDWYINRNVDISEEIEKMKLEKICFSDASLKFLKEFMFLKISYKSSVTGNNILLSFNYKEGLSREYPEVISNDYTKAIGVNCLTLIGTYTNYFTLLMDESGYIYAVEDGYIIKFGKTYSGINNLLSSKYDIVPTPEWW